MQVAFPATLFIILWSLVWTFLWAYWVYRRISRSNVVRHVYAQPHTNSLIMPSLVIAPLALMSFYTIFEINLIYPIQLLSGARDLIFMAMIPSLILFWTSGLLIRIKRSVHDEYRFWIKKPFNQVSKAYGIDPRSKLKKIVITRAVLESWNLSLPWFIGEMFVIECIFNAPGIGFYLWRHARTHNLDGVISHTIAIGILYLILAIIMTTLARNIGKRLESYH